jgi:cyclopropane-fatty-acyl-phospholipid synthase
LQRLRDANTLRGSRRNIGRHYDLSNDLYRVFLDESMTYSCGVFTSPTDTLEEAQRAKLDGICRRLGLQRGQHVLEIGSGWGSFAMHAAQHYGCRVTSITLSAEQQRLATERIAAAGLSDLVDIQFRDYRKMTGLFDHIISIEMLEAVGYEYFATFFRACDRLLKQHGRMFLQTITVPDQRFDSYRREFDWIRKYIFPGGCLASVAAVNETLKRHTTLQMEWMREIGTHYAPTLRHWRERFFAKLPEVRRLGFDDRFIRMWEFYLASCEAGFATRYIGDVQMVLSRPPRPAAPARLREIP